ncbi:MAG: hypothetical protein K2Z81_23710 [Cyanobacteria bacterium]|nr:hypothetical protein [Cyanobacteriota bacterium]
MSTKLDVEQLIQSLNDFYKSSGGRASLRLRFSGGWLELDRDLIRARTSTGGEESFKRGLKFFRPSKITPKQLKVAKRLLKEGQSAREVAEVFAQI